MHLKHSWKIVKTFKILNICPPLDKWLIPTMEGLLKDKFLHIIIIAWDWA